MANTTRKIRRNRHLAALLGAGFAAVALTGSAMATTPVGDQVRLSVTGTDGDATRDAIAPAMAHNPRTGQHLVVWSRIGAPGVGAVGRLINADGTPAGPEFPISSGGVSVAAAVAYNTRANEFLVLLGKAAPGGDIEAFVRRVSAAGVPLGAAEERISAMGPDGNPNFVVDAAAIAYNGVHNEYLAAWVADDNRGPLVDDEKEVFVQRLAADGSQIGTDDQRISNLGPNGNPAYQARHVAVAYNEIRDEYLVAFTGDDNRGGVVDGEEEAFVQRVSWDGLQVGTDDLRISTMGGTGDPLYSALFPTVVHNPATDEYQVAWLGDDTRGGGVDGEFEVFGQRLSSDGTQVGTDDQRISDMGPNGNAAYDADAPKLAYNARSNEYLVAWAGDDDTAPLVDNKTEVHVQRLSAAGVELDGNDVRVSNMEAAADTTARSDRPAVAYDANANQYLVTWEGASTVSPLVAGEFEIYARRFGAGTPVTVASQCKVLPPQAPPPAGDPSKITLSVDQLLINQRIDQAAIRRANGVQAWLDAGVESRDLCQAALGAEELYPGSAGGYTAVPATYGAPDPRPVQIPAATPGDPSKVTLTIDQLLINQRISQAAIRRLNALKARLDAGLTSGDIDDGAVGRAQLKAGTSVLYVPVVATPPAASVTTIAPPSPGDPSKVTLTVNQLLINQRISQAAVKRANDLIYRLGQGIGPEEVRNGTLTTADLAPGLPISTAP